MRQLQAIRTYQFAKFILLYQYVQAYVYYLNNVSEAEEVNEKTVSGASNPEMDTVSEEIKCEESQCIKEKQENKVGFVSDSLVSMNLYQGMNMNPVNYTDPMGNSVLLNPNLSKAQRRNILNNLQKLTSDILFIKNNKEIRIRKLLSGKKMGAKLLRRMIRSKRKVTVKIGNSGNTENDINPTNAINSVGSDAKVDFDPTSSPRIKTYNPKTKRVIRIGRPNQIGFGHEMVHADRSMRGDAVKYSLIGEYSYKDSTGTTKTATAPIEELETVGITNWKMTNTSRNTMTTTQYNNLMKKIGSNRKLNITENDLRGETSIYIPILNTKVKILKRGAY